MWGLERHGDKHQTKTFSSRCRTQSPLPRTVTVRYRPARQGTCCYRHELVWQLWHNKQKYVTRKAEQSRAEQPPSRVACRLQVARLPGPPLCTALLCITTGVAVGIPSCRHACITLHTGPFHLQIRHPSTHTYPHIHAGLTDCRRIERRTTR